MDNSRKMEFMELKLANELFRRGHYQSAKDSYKYLHLKNPDFSVYRDNLAEAERRLGDSGKAPEIEPVDEFFTAQTQSCVEVYFLQACPLVLPLGDTLDKLCFYIQALGDRLAGINIFLDDDLLGSVADIEESRFPNLGRLRKKIRVQAKDFLGDAYRNSTCGEKILYLFDQSVLSAATNFLHPVISEFQHRGAAWRIHDSIQHHGSFYLKSLERYFDPTAATQRLRDALTRLADHPHSRRCIVVGTGPSLKFVYAVADLDRSLIVTCNSAIYNDTLMHTLDPHIVCATDPVFHAGWGKYAEEFRAALVRRMDQFSFLFVVPARDHHIYLHYLPARLHHRIACYNLESAAKEFNLDLTASTSVKSTPNVLTNIMLPIAATISKEITIVGCDGKAESSSYFWAHDPSSQINKHMGDIQEQFKGFFDIDYDKYYGDHCVTLDGLITAMEKKGCAVQSGTPSYIPALARRSKVPSCIQRCAGQSVDVTVVMPARDAAATLMTSCQSVGEAALQAALRVRIVIIDDGSFDTTARVAQEFGQVSTGVDVVTIRTKGLGVAGARNVGLGFVNSDFICFLDADDQISVDSFRERKAAYEAARSMSDKVIGAFSATRLVEGRSNKQLGVSNDYKVQGRRYSFVDVSNPAHISSILYSAAAVEAARFEFGRNFGEDWLFLAQVLAKGGELVFVSKSHSIYSINSSSSTQKNPQLHILALFEVVESIYTGKGLGETSPALSGGLSALRCTHSLAEKRAHLVARLLGALIAKRRAPEGRQTLKALSETGGYSASTVALIEADADRYSAMVHAEARRFSSDDFDDAGFKCAVDGLHLANIHPRLYRALTNSCNPPN